MKKRILSVVLLSTVLMAACGDKKEETPEPTSDPSTYTDGRTDYFEEEGQFASVDFFGYGDFKESFHDDTRYFITFSDVSTVEAEAYMKQIQDSQKYSDVTYTDEDGCLVLDGYDKNQNMYDFFYEDESKELIITIYLA